MEQEYGYGSTGGGGGTEPSTLQNLSNKHD